jgi:hypothetical protein
MVKARGMFSMDTVHYDLRRRQQRIDSCAGAQGCRILVMRKATKAYFQWSIRPMATIVYGFVFS